MDRIKSFKSIAYILSGSLLYLYNGVSGGWTSGLAAIFGFVIFIIGLDMLRSGLDQPGQSGAGLMRIAAIIGAIASLIDLIPLLGWLSGMGFIAAFAILLIGLLRLRNSATIGSAGSEGATRLAIAMAISIVAAVISILPFLGNIMASFFALASMLLSFTGWLKIQDGILETSVEPAEV